MKKNFQLKNATLEQRRQIQELASDLNITIHCDLTKANVANHPDIEYVGDNYISENLEPVCIDSCRNCAYEEVTLEEFIIRITKLHSRNEDLSKPFIHDGNYF